VAITKGNVDDSVMCEGGEGRDDGGLLASTWTSGGDEEASILASELSSCPKLAGRVPESLFDNQITFAVGGALRTFHCAGMLPYLVGTPRRNAS